MSLPQTKKKTTSRKKKTTARRSSRNRKNSSDNSVRFIFAIIVIAISIFGLFQLGIIGRAVDSFFNYLFGWSRYMTYILISLISLYIAFAGKIPKSRRTSGIFLLQFVLLLIAQLNFHFTKGVLAEREPVLSYVYSAYDSSRFPDFGGGLIGFYLLAIFEPLVSIIGVILITIVLSASSIILIMKLRHRDVLKSLFTKIKDFSQAASAKIKQQRIKAQEKKQQRSEEKQQQLLENGQQDSEVKDVSDLPEITGNNDIPIYNHNEKGQANHSSRKKRRFETTDMNSDTDENKAPSLEAETNEETMIDDQVGSSISEAGEVANEAYHIPPLSLLNQPTKQQTTSKAEVQRKGRVLETTLKNFGVNAKVTQIKIGPAVTQYEIQPAQGVKVSKIVNLHNDIALALAAKDVRIEAPIPGRSAVGIEVPNDKISLVTLKEVLDSKFPAQNKLEVGLGRDISGDPMTIQLNEMPHLLVAGSTGSGKSVCINGIITSILLNAKPHEVKLMLIDPKMVELNVYNGIPHLLIPVVTNPHKAAQALEKIVAEMERRYDLFQHSSTRNIEGYNQYIRQQNAELDEKQAELPYIVVIVDELADLMMVAGKDVENAIQRITQMARAAGIHLIVATQRPSVDVITGIIKNNIPSRIAFAVSSQTDSRTIIGSGGAEKLLGKGDMLYVGNGESSQTRVQGAFLSDYEVQEVVNYVVEQQQANYVKEMEPDAPVDKSEMKSEDELYDEAYLFVLEKQKASTSLLQRQFRIGYNRASRLMDDLERNQVIGPQKGSKPRQVLIDLDNDEV